MRELLRRAGFDIDAKIAALKIELEDKAQHAVRKVKDEARRVALGSALWLGVAVMGFLLLLVALTALYLAVEMTQGPFVALGAVALALILLAAVLAVAALTMARSRSPSTHILFARPLVPPPVVELREAPAAAPPPGGTARGAFRDILMPLLGLVGRYRPLTGHWGVDGVIRHAGSRTQATAQDAVLRAADLVQTGSRGTMIGVLVAAGVLGWLVARRRH
jgi:hypothetical protein